MDETPRAVLTNGLSVANLITPHAYVFEDQTTLPARAPETVALYPLSIQESEKPYLTRDERTLAWIVTRRHVCPQPLIDMALALVGEKTKDGVPVFDIVLVQPKMMRAWRESGIEVPVQVKVAVPANERGTKWSISRFSNE